MRVLSFQSCPTLCDPMYCSLPGSSVHGISRQEYWSGSPCQPLGDLSEPGIKPTSLKSPAFTPPNSKMKKNREGGGGGIGMGNTCKSMADSCQCMTKTTTIL